MNEVKVLSKELMPLIKELLDQNQSVKFKISGTSMLPFFKHHKTSVTLIKKTSYQKYDAILYQTNDAYILHRLIKVKDHFFLTCGDALKQIEKIDKKSVIGYVSSFEYGGKTTNSFSKLYLFKVKLWYLFKPFRSILLRFLKRK